MTGGVQHLPEAQRLALLINALSDHAIFMLDLDGFIVSWNSGAQRIKGFAAEEIIGQHFSRFFTAQDRGMRLPERILETARSVGRHETEGWRVRKDGSRFWCHAVVQAVRDPAGTLIGFAKISRDVTERVAAQQALLDSERRFRVLVEGVVDYAICMLDPSGIVIEWNKGAERLKGYRADEIVGQHFSKFYTRENREKGLPAQILLTAAREGRYEAEGWRVRKDGSRFWASVVIDTIRNKSGDIEGFAKITRDITERRAAQETLRESERQFRLLVANVTDYAIFMLDPNGIVTSWNNGAQRIKGYTADEIVGQHFSRFYMDRDRQAGLPARALHCAMTEGRFESQGWRVRKDATTFWAHVVIDPIRDESGDLIGFAKITRDITDKRQAELELQETQAQRAQAQKMEALGQLTGGVAHDFNNLLMVVSGYIPLLKKMVADDPKAARAAEAIELAAKRGASLTRHLLTFSRRQTFTPTVFDLGERIQAFQPLLSSSAGAKVRLVAAIGRDIWPVRVDANELELSIVNMVVNARDAMPDGGSVSITAENVTIAAGDTLAIQGDFVALHVSDTGTGIPPDVLPRVFDPFFTTKGVNQGTGLGLSQVHGFAHQSGGTVKIDSEYGRGTTLTLYLPRAREPLNAQEHSREGESIGAGSVLIVEDNPDVAAVTASIVQQLGYGVVAASHADAALDAIARQTFDFVVSDIVMAGSMDGWTLARTIRDRWPKLPVVLVTGYSQAAPQAEREFALLRKPFTPAELGRVAARAIAQAKAPEGGNIVRLRNSKQ